MESKSKRHLYGLVHTRKHYSYIVFHYWRLLIFISFIILPPPPSPQHPELVLVGYYTNPNVPHDPDGVALMWDLKFHKETPDYIFNCQVSKKIDIFNFFLQWVIQQLSMCK